MREHLSRGRRLNTSSKAATNGKNNQATEQNTPSFNIHKPGTSKSSSSQNGKSRSASAGKNKNRSSDRVKKAEKSLLYQNQFNVLSADDADEEVMDTSSNERTESVWGNYPSRGRQTERTHDGGRFTSCLPNTDGQRHGKISPIRAPPK